MRFLIFTTLFLIPALALAAPGVPHQLHGLVDGFTSGTVSVLIDGSTVASTSIAGDGTFGASGNLFFVEDPDSTYAGEAMSFKINDSAATNTLTYQNGGFNELALSVASEGGGSPGGGVSLSAPVPLESFLLGDFNKDGVVDIQDFNFLISYWGAPAADLNGDGTTDILDFTILMANWT